MARRGRPRSTHYEPHAGHKPLRGPDVDFGGSFAAEPLPGGTVDKGVARITDSSRATPDPSPPPAPRATVTSLRVEREARIGPDRDARQAETEKRIARMLAEHRYDGDDDGR